MKVLFYFFTAAALFFTSGLSAAMVGGGPDTNFGQSDYGGTEGQMKRLRASHIKDLALSREAEQLMGNVESLALEALRADPEDLDEIWPTAEQLFRLSENNAESAHDALRYAMDVFKLSSKLSESEESLAALGDPGDNKEHRKAVKEQEKRIEKTRKKIKKLRREMRDEIKDILDDTEENQLQGFENWLMVSEGTLSDAREAKQASITPPRVILSAPENVSPTGETK